MKLRNKKTGLTGTLTFIGFNIDESEKETDITILLDDTGGECIDKQVYSLEELKKFLEEWEDVKEPLIKDPEIRVWADVMEVETVEFNEFWYGFRRDNSTICFMDLDDDIFKYLEDGKDYTIAELCGRIKMNDHGTYVTFVLPKPFIRHFKEDKFEDSFERIKADISAVLENKTYGCSGNYELEVIKMLEEALKASNIR